MKKPGQNNFCVANWQVTPATGLLTSGRKAVRLEPKVMEVLVYLVERHQEVVTREELERDVWRGALIGYDAVTNTVIKLRKALNDDARHPRFIATIPKMGYQFIAPITYPEINESSPSTTLPITGEPEKSAQVQLSPVSENKTGINKTVLIAFAIGGLFAFTSLWWLTMGRNVDSEPPSIVVLPFKNLSNIQEQEYIADGITEDIITDLSRLSSLLVIASNTSFRYKGEQVSIEKVGADLDVSFVLKGSVRQRGENIRVNAQLVDAKTGYNVWAAFYDRKMSEMFSVQDEVTRDVTNALAIKLTTREEQHLSKRATDSLRAYDFFQEGRRLSRISTKDANEQARIVYRKAIDLDPDYGRVYGALAYTLATDYQSGWTNSPQWTLDRALELANKGIALDSSVPQTAWSLGFVYVMRKDFANAEKAAERSIRISPNYADGYALLALINLHLGKPQRAIDLISKGMRLNPYFTWEYLNIRGNAYYMLKNYPEAIATLEKAQARNEYAIPVKLFLAASYAAVGRQNDAEWTTSLVLALNPQISISDIEKSTPIANTEIKRRFLTDLKQAGFPE